MIFFKTTGILKIRKLIINMYTFWGSETVFHKIIGENLKKF